MDGSFILLACNLVYYTATGNDSSLIHFGFCTVSAATFSVWLICSHNWMFLSLLQYVLLSGFHFLY